MKISKEFINDIYNAEKQQKLLFFIGAGVSISQGYPSWNKYVDELIQYWKANLIKIAEDERTIYSKVNRNDYEVLDTLLNSNFSNKRKVDLVNHMIERYSMSHNKEESIKIYNKYVLSFEKFFFQDMPPLDLNNDILRKLTKLKANFITTNYDKSIEKNIELQGRDTVNTYNDYSEVPEILTYPSVMHIHGTPNSNPKYFVSSASSYNFIYLEENNITDLMRNLFAKKEIYTIIFLGCSLEEEEIMNLLSKKVKNVKLYALMKMNNNLYFNNFIKEYYYKKYNINIVWYGSDYKDLPLFIESFINEVHRKKKLYDYEEVYKALTTVNDKDENINVINNVIDNGDYSKLNRSIKEVLSKDKSLKKIAINNLKETKILTTDILKNTVELFNIWSLIANQYEEIDIDRIDQIIDNSKYLERFNDVILASLIRIVEQRIRKFNQKAQIDYIEEYLKLYLKNEWFVESNNKYINFLWIINGINSNRHAVDINKLDEIKLNNLIITDELGKRIINRLRENDLSLEIKTYHEIMQDVGIKSIIKLWENNKITFGKRISKKLISLPIIHKILIHRIMEKKIKNEELIKKIVESIDAKYIFYDMTVKNFIDTYSQKYDLPNKLKNYDSSHFKNEIVSSEAFWVKDKPFYSIDLDNLTYNSIEELLIKAITQPSYYNKKDYYSLEGQNNELYNSFKKAKLSKKKKKNIFKNLNENEDISENYTHAINKILIFCFSNKILTLNDINIFLEKKIKEKKLVEIDEDLLNALEDLIKNFQINTNKIFKLIMTIDLSEYNEASLKNTDNIVDIARFINSKIGRYFDIVSHCSLETQKNKDKVKEKIKENNFIKNYLIGQFINLYEIEELPTANVDIFVGFSQKYILSKNSYHIGYFESIAKYTFENNMYDDFLYTNLTLILIERINPIADIDFYKIKKEKAKYIFKTMLDIYLNNIEGNYFNNWVEWFVENLELEITLINKIIENIYSKKFENLNNLLIILKKLKISKKIKYSQIAHIYKLSEFDKECLEFYYNLLLTLKNDNIIIFDGESLIYIDYLFERVNNISSEELQKKFSDLLRGEFPSLD